MIGKLFVALLIVPMVTFAFNLKQGTLPLQFGGFIINQGKNQTINVQDLKGNGYNLNNYSPANFLIGAGYFIDGLDKNNYQLTYGINAFYFTKTTVKGLIFQELLYSNLSYRYKVQHAPLYFATKTILKNNLQRYNVILDAGIGPNFMRISGYEDPPLNEYSLPDNAFSAHNNVTFSAMAGIGIRFNNTNNIPLECGYRFFI